MYFFFIWILVILLTQNMTTYWIVSDSSYFCQHLFIYLFIYLFIIPCSF